MSRTLVLGLLLLLPLVGGCESGSTTRPSGGDRVLTDPMNYKPGWDDTNISGGGILEYNDKAMRRDLNEVLNP